MTAALVLLVALQGSPPAVTAQVDRLRLAAGEELHLTIRARTRSAEPVTVVLPALAGFSIIGSREVTDVTVEGLGGPVRLTTRELDLRAGRPGTIAIGPVRVRLGGREVRTAPLLVTVDSAPAGLATALSPVARGLLDGAVPPPHNDRVELTVIVPTDSALVGQQLDVIAAAWFPRELRTRLRRPPIVTMQTPEGVWSYPGAAPSGVAASRLVRGRWMDLFAAHQAVFPLAPGRLVIPPATVEYAVPVTFSFFSREDRYSLRSDSVSLAVLPLPAGSASGEGVVAHGLGLGLTVTPPAARVGEPLDVTVEVSGVGNVDLWPEPVLAWPRGLRAYAGETRTEVAARDGRIGGRKSFHYLVVPDQAGSFLLPELRYPYFDLAARAYGVATAAPRELVVAPEAEPRPARALPPLLTASRPAWTDLTARGLVPWGWLALLVGPPLVAWRWRRRRVTAIELAGTPPPAVAGAGGPADEPGAPAPAAAPASTRLGRLEREFYALLASHVPDPAARDGDGLARALRAAAVESATADHVMRLRDRLRAARYGPAGSGDARELAAELEKVLRVLGVEAPGRRRWASAALAVAALAALARPVTAQRPSAEALYQAGALRAAADSFAARAAAEPRVAAHWYDLGATLYRAGADGKASAAWTVAARLAPRNAVIRRARELLPAPDAPSASLLAAGVATLGEWALGTAALWVALWLAVATGARRGTVAALATLDVALGALALATAVRQTRPLAIVATADAAVRVAPYGTATPAATLGPGAALLVERRYGNWLEVYRADGVHGWLLAADVAPL